MGTTSPRSHEEDVPKRRTGYLKAAASLRDDALKDRRGSIKKEPELSNIKRMSRSLGTSFYLFSSATMKGGLLSPFMNW